MLKQKREQLTSITIRIPRFSKIPTLYRDWLWDPWSKKRVNYLSCIDRKGECSAQNAALFIDHYMISFIKAQRGTVEKEPVF